MRYFNRKTTLIIFFLMLQVAGALPAQEINISGEVSEQFRASEAERQRDTIYISLSNALEELVANNELLKKAEARTKAASFAYEQAKGEMLPKVDADFTYDYLDIVPGFRSELLGNIQHDMFPKIKVSQQIYAGGKLKYAKEAASAKTASMQQAFLAEKIDLKLSLCINYFRLQSLLSQKQIIRANLARLQKQQQYTRLMVNAGRMSQLEIGRIDVAMEEAEGDLLRIDNEYQTTSNRIGLLMGRQSGRLFLPEDSLQLIPYDVDEKAMFATALDNNPLWKQTQLDLHGRNKKLT
ncbi:MAG: TolC family protein [Candidatus Marinimicrobia bacterium]|nr:TolC family protein [Candidatus Neomarinimicrobiota bacterium]